MESKTEREAFDRAVLLTSLTDGAGLDWLYRRFQEAQKSMVPLHLHMRSSGDLLPADALRAMGLRANTKLSRQFFDLLTEQGRADPVEAAYTLAATISRAAHQYRDLKRIGGYELGLRWELLPSVGAAGACPAVHAIAGKAFDTEAFPDVPLDQCDRLGQCMCIWKTVL